MAASWRRVWLWIWRRSGWCEGRRLSRGREQSSYRIRTGIRHPANHVTNFTSLTNTDIGYDRNANILRIHNNIFKINKIDGSGPETADPKTRRDYDLINQIWNKGGISIVSTENPNVIIAPIDGSDRSIKQALNRESLPVVNDWYGTTGVVVRNPVDSVTRDPKSLSATNGTIIFYTV
jgi:hypothetical protein